jgi:hypothetical protein
MKTVIAFLIFLNLKPLLAEELKVHDSPHKIETYAIHDKAEQRWEKFLSEADWFLNELSLKIEDEECDALEKTLHEEWAEERKAVKKAFIESQQKFVELRESLAHLFFLNGKGQYADCSSATATFDLTSWYTEYLEKRLFTPGWKEEYLKSKKKAIPDKRETRDQKK